MVTAGRVLRRIGAMKVPTLQSADAASNMSVFLRLLALPQGSPVKLRTALDPSQALILQDKAITDLLRLPC